MRTTSRLFRTGVDLVLAIVVLAPVAAPLSAQRFGRGRSYRTVQTPLIQNPAYDGRFTFARLSYTTNSPDGYYYGGLPAWAHGYDKSERNLVQIVNALSSVHPRLETGVVYNLDDPALFKYPIAYMTEAGFWGLTDSEAVAFRRYLLKGGFVIFDDFRSDFRGGGGYNNFVANMKRILPDARIVNLSPTDPIFHSFYEINSLTIIPQYYDQGRPVLQGIYQDNDPSKRLLAVINYNTDVSNFWEYSGEGYAPIDESNEAYKLGVNYLIYAMSH